MAAEQRFRALDLMENPWQNIKLLDSILVWGGVVNLKISF